MESYSSEIQKELTQAQENLINEIESRNKYVKQLNTSLTEKEELKQTNTQLTVKVANLEKTVDQLQKKLKQYEEQLNVEPKKQGKGKDNELTKALDLGSTSEEPKVPTRMPSARGRKDIKEAKKVSTVQINFSKK